MTELLHIQLKNGHFLSQKIMKNWLNAFMSLMRWITQKKLGFIWQMRKHMIEEMHHIKLLN